MMEMDAGMDETLVEKGICANIRELFTKARNVVTFHGETKRLIGEKLKELAQLSHFRQLVCSCCQLIIYGKVATALLFSVSMGC